MTTLGGGRFDKAGACIVSLAKEMSQMNTV